MSLHIAAQNLASKGRGPDTMLIHMSRGEIKSLNDLARANGGSLTINPETGLPEAGFLSKLLPTLIGAGLTFFSGGTLTPVAAAMMTGAGYGVATGSLKKGLMAGLGAYGGAGLASGLGAAGATVPAEVAATEGLSATAGASPLAGMEAAAMENPAVAGFDATNAVANPMDAVKQGVLDKISPGSTITPTAPTLSLTAAPPTVPAETGMLRGMEGAAMENPAVHGFQAANTGPSTDLGKSFGSLGTDAGQDAFMRKVGGGSGLMQKSMMAFGPALMAATPENAGYKDSGPNPYEYSYDYKTGQYTRQKEGYRDSLGMNPLTPRAMADGGYAYSYDPATQQYKQAQEQDPRSSYDQLSMMNKFIVSGMMGGMGGNPQMQQALMGPMTEHLLQRQQGAGGYSYSYDPVTQRYTQLSAPAPVGPETTVGFDGAGGIGGESGGGGGSVGANGASGLGTGVDGFGASYAHGGIASLAQGGQSHLGDYSDGGRLLRGPGDGVSDSIPAVIGNKRPARLADGEFVVPARIVSELGNGSSEAGARKLYAMMDRVQGARKKSVGKGKVAVNSRADKALPA